MTFETDSKHIGNCEFPFCCGTKNVRGVSILLQKSLSGLVRANSCTFNSCDIQLSTEDWLNQKRAWMTNIFSRTDAARTVRERGLLPEALVLRISIARSFSDPISKQRCEGRGYPACCGDYGAPRQWKPACSKSRPIVCVFAGVLLGLVRPGHPRKLRGIYAAEAA